MKATITFLIYVLPVFFGADNPPKEVFDMGLSKKEIVLKKLDVLNHDLEKANEYFKHEMD